eukprot:Skav233768  [mRNA]  locus=scaffold780:22559:24241:- [translate_table: standard]
MSTASFYDVLRVDPTATVDEIKLAFKRRALQVHPDKGGNKEAFHLAYQALETLSDPEARKRYDSRRASGSSVPDNQRSEAQTKVRKAKGHPKTKHAAASTEGNHSQSKAAGNSPSAMPQSKQTRLLVQLHALLKQLPRDVRNDVFKQQFSQKQRLILENWMEEQLHPTRPATLRAVAQSAPNHDDKPLARERNQISICSPSREECPAMGATSLMRWFGKNAKRKRRKKDRKADSGKRLKRAQGRVLARNGRGSHCGYRAEIYFDALHVYTGATNFQTALDYLVVLTFVKQKMRDLAGNSASFEERFQETLSSCAMAHGLDIADMSVRFCVSQSCNFFLGTEVKLRTPVVRNIQQLGQMRRCLEPFRQYSSYMGRRSSLYWWYTPAHLQDAWERLQDALAEAFKVSKSDSTRTLQKIRAGHEASAQLRARALQYWERQQMAAEDKNRYRPRRFKVRSSRPMERRERQEMTLHDKNQHRPRRLQDPTFTAHKLMSRRLLTLKLLLGKWDRMLTQQQKKDRTQRRRLELLKRKQMQQEARLKREAQKIKRRKYSGFMEDLQWI